MSLFLYLLGMDALVLSMGNSRHIVQDKRVLRLLEGAKDFGKAVESVLFSGVEAVSFASGIGGVLNLEDRCDQILSGVESKCEAVVESFREALKKQGDPSLEDSAASAVIRAMDSQVASLLAAVDPSSPNSPIGLACAELRAVARENDRAIAARAAVESKTTLKGRGFEAAVADALTDICGGSSDLATPVGDSEGSGGSKKGDVLVICRDLTAGVSASVSVEIKRRRISLTDRYLDSEVRSGIKNRGCRSGILVVHPEFKDCVGRSLKVVAPDIVVCVCDPENGDVLPLEVAFQVARAAAMSSVCSSVDLTGSSLRTGISSVMAKIEDLAIVEQSLGKTVDDIERSRSSILLIRKRILMECRDVLSGNASQPLSEDAPPMPPHSAKKSSNDNFRKNEENPASDDCYTPPWDGLL